MFCVRHPFVLNTFAAVSAVTVENLPDAAGHFGPYGGRYVPEMLMHPLQELEAEYFRAQHKPSLRRWATA
jgi:tryptophan synthase beta chain